MNKGSLIVDFIIIICITLPLVYLIMYSFNSERKIKKRVTTSCQKHGMNLNHFELSGNLILGMDEQQQKLIYSNRKDPEGEFRIIHLHELSNCHVKTIQNSKKTLDWVGLELSGKERLNDIPFYVEDDDDDPGTSAEVCLQTARKWEKLILPLIKTS
jgi:hypothetical protein